MLDEILAVKVAAVHFACDVICTAYFDGWQMLRFHFFDGAVLYLVESIASDLGTCGADISVSTGKALLGGAPVAAFGQVRVLWWEELEGLAGVGSLFPLVGEECFAFKVPVELLCEVDAHVGNDVF